MNQFETFTFVARNAYYVARRPKQIRAVDAVLTEYSEGWNHYWDRLRSAKTLEDWMRIPGVEDQPSYYGIDGRVEYKVFDSALYYRTRLLQALDKHFRNASSATEFGSGLGRNVLFLKSRNPKLKVNGYELCKPGVEIAREAARKFNIDCEYSQLDYVRGASKEYVFPPADVGFSMFSLEQLPRDNKLAVENIRKHCNLGSIHIEPVPENYPFTPRGLLGKLDHWKVDYLSSFDRNVLSIGFSEVTKEVLTSSHNPLMFPSLYVLRK